MRFLPQLQKASRLGPVLDVACGDGRNGLLVAGQGASVLLVDKDERIVAAVAALEHPLHVHARVMDLETGIPPDFGQNRFGAVLVFRYLHRPLIPLLKRCLVPGGVLLYETFLVGHEALGKPRNPGHLLKPGELAAWFAGWKVFDIFEGRLEHPERIMGRIACEKPAVATP